MCSLWMQELEIPKVVVSRLSLRNLVVGFWLRSVNHIWELYGILNKEDWNVVSNEIPVTFLGVELDGESTNISNGIGGTS